MLQLLNIPLLNILVRIGCINIIARHLTDINHPVALRRIDYKITDLDLMTKTVQHADARRDGPLLGIREDLNIFFLKVVTVCRDVLQVSDLFPTDGNLVILQE